MEALGAEVLARLDLDGSETVLDAGCGSGRVTRLLLERLPRGRVVAFDASPGMADLARRSLPAGRCDVRLGDLASFRLAPPADAILSTAAFHWVADHDAMFRSLRASVRAGGRLEAQCGGAGNVAALHEAVARVQGAPQFRGAFAGWQGPWNFAGPAETERRLLAAGFSSASCWLEPRTVVPEEPRAYLESICLGAHLQALPEALRGEFLDACLLELGDLLELGYVRLNVSAVA